LRFRLCTSFDDECKDESTTTLVFEYLRDIKTAKTSIIVQYVDVLEVLKGRPKQIKRTIEAQKYLALGCCAKKKNGALYSG
jgi:hypothetical protein